MNLKAFKTINTGEYELDVVQSNIAAFVQQFTSLPILTGQLIKGIAVVSGDNAIAHKLARQYQGWILTSISAAVTIYENTTAANQGTFLTLHASGSATIALWVF